MTRAWNEKQWEIFTCTKQRAVTVPWFSCQHWISSASPPGDAQPPVSSKEGWCSSLLTGFFSCVSRSHYLKPLPGDQWRMKQQCLEGKPFICLLVAERSVGAVRRTCPMSVCTAKGIPGPLTWWCRLAMFLPHRACSDPWCSTRPEIFACLAFMPFSPRIHHACAHLPWKEPGSGCTGSLSPALLRQHVTNHCCVCCFCLSDGLLVSSLAHLSVCCVLSNGTRQRADPWGVLY